MFERWMGAETFREGIRLYMRRHRGGTATSADLLAALDEVSDNPVSPAFLTFLTQPGVPLVTGTGAASCDAGSRTLKLTQERFLPIGSRGDPNQTWQIPVCIRHSAGMSCYSLTEAEGEIELPGCPTWWMPNADGAGYFRFSMSADDWTALRTKGFQELSDRGQMAVADSAEAAFERGTMNVDAMLPWFSMLVSSPLRQLVVAPMRPLRFMIDDAAPAELRGKVTAYASRLYRARYRRLGWRSRPGDSSDTKILREAVIRFMVMDVRDRDARQHAARLGRSYIGYRSKAKPRVVDPQLAGLVLATAVQVGGSGLFDHLLALLESSSDATARNRILAALGHAETPELSARALELVLDPRVRVNEIRYVLRQQFQNPRTRERAWQWFTDNFDAFAARFGRTQVGDSPWNAASFCTEEAAADVQRFFDPKVAELSGGPRNLATAVEAISLCAEQARVLRPGIERAFGSR